MLEFSSSGASLFGSAGASAPSSAGMNQSNSSSNSVSGAAGLFSQFGRSNSTGAGSATSMFNILGGSSGMPPLDLNEFPSLGGANINFAQASSTGRQPYVGLLKDNVGVSTVANEFSIQNEDFPALPGAPAGGGAPRSTSPGSVSLQAALAHSFGASEAIVNPLASLTQQISAAAGVLGTSSLRVGAGGDCGSSLGSNLANNSPSSAAGGAGTPGQSGNPRPESTESSQTQSSSTGNSAPSSSATPSGSSGGGGGNGGGASGGSGGGGDRGGSKKSSIQLTKDGHLANIPPGMLTDQFGMAGLVALLANTENNQNLFSLAIGYDISSINLNLNSKERIYQTYPGPWNEKQLKPYEIDYPVPSEYLINHSIRDKIADIKTNQYSEDLLFFLFYFFAGETMQALATTELMQRDWRYHKDENVWIRRQANIALTEKNNSYERGTYIYFDPINWMKLQKEMTVEYERLETQPTSNGQFQ